MADMKIKLTKFDAADYVETAEDVAWYLEAALEDDDPAEFAAALGVVARSKGATEIARKAGLSRDAIYKAFSEDGNPNLATLLGVMRALGVRLSVKVVEDGDGANYGQNGAESENTLKSKA